MTLPATPQIRPLRAVSNDEARPFLGQLFAAYPEPWKDKSAAGVQALIDAKVNAYLLGLSGVPGWAIEETVRDYIQGRVERRRRDVLPTAEEIAAHARKLVDNEATIQRLAEERRKQLKEAREWQDKQAWLQTEEGQRHQRERAERAAEIMRRIGQSHGEEA